VIRPLRIIALDLSTAATAIATTNGPGGAALLHTYTVPGTAKKPLHQQIDIIDTAVRRATGWQPGPAAWVPDLVVIEGTFSRIGGSDYPLHALHAVIKQRLYRRGIPYVDIAPATLKTWATGSGATSGVNKVTKDKVVAAILAQYGTHLLINPRDDNQCDAVGLLTMALANYGQPLGDLPTVNHRRALKVPAWPTLEGIS
jgi:crossover junction endodeoxyribonuclease RuvC